MIFPRITLFKWSMFVLALIFSMACSQSELMSYNVDEPLTFFHKDTVETVVNAPVTISHLDKNTGEKIENVSIIKISKPELGTAVLNENNTITYNPHANATGEDKFEYYAEVFTPEQSIITEIVTIKIKIKESDESVIKPFPKGSNIYYVTTNGKSSNDGATEETAWDIQHAFKTAVAGDIVYVKAGNYGTVNLRVANSGTAAKQIKFIGYKVAPNDINATNGSTFQYGRSTYSTQDYPTLEGKRNGGRVDGTAILIPGRYVEIHNFQIKDKLTGVRATGGHNKLNNIIVHDMGNHTGYSGWGVVTRGNYNEFTNSFIRNGVELFGTSGSYQLIENNWLGCDQKINNDYSTDYYLLLTGSNGIHANYNTIKNNTIYREPGQYHQGHGLIIKGTGQYNNIIDNDIYNAPLEFSFEGVAYNTVTGGTIKGTGATGDGPNVRYAFILVANGAHHNTFQDMTVTGDSGVRFSDWDDGWTPTPDTDAEDAGNNNLFKNIHFDNLINGIEFSWHWRGSGAATNNTFENCTFSNISNALFVTERPNSGTVLKNCTFKDSPRAIFNEDTKNLARVAPKGQKKKLNVTFINPSSNNIGFRIPR